MITKNNYISIGDIIKENIRFFNNKPNHIDIQIIDDLCIYFKEDNPAFDEARFKKFIGVE